MLSRATQRTARTLFSTQKRAMGGHGPQGGHLLGTRQADYIQQQNIYNELPETPGVRDSMNDSSYFLIITTILSTISLKVLYNVSKPVRVEVEKVTVVHPDTKEEVFLFKPTGIHKDGKELFGYDLVKAPKLEYTRMESMVAEKMALYNDEMEFWLTHGKDAESFLGRPFRIFDPKTALVTDAQTPDRFKPAVINHICDRHEV